MNILQSSITYAAGQLFFNGFPVAGFRSFKAGLDVRVTVFSGQEDLNQVRSMRLVGIKVTRVKQ